MQTLSEPVVSLPDTFNAASYFVDANIECGNADRTAIIYESHEYTYADVAEMVNRAANAFAALGLDTEQRALLLLLDSPAFVASFFGAMKMGAVAVPLNTLMKSHDYAYFLQDSRARLLVVSEALLPVVEPVLADQPYLKHVIVVADTPGENDAAFTRKGYLLFHDLLAVASPKRDAAPTSKDEVAFWLYSSGTTGAPKGAVHLHRDMVYCAELYAKKILNISAEDRCFSVAKLFFAYGLGNGLYFPFAVGASTVLLPGAPKPATVLDLCARTKPSLLFGVPTSYAALLGEATERDTRLASVRQGVSAGEALPAAVWQRFKERFGVEILDGIGSTEVLHIFISNRAGAVKPGSSGQIVPGYAARLLDPEGRDVGVGEEGALLIRGDSTAAYYWNKADKTRATMQGEWIRTGDLYHVDADGYYWYHGRADDMIKAGGIWVSPLEVEATLTEHAAVRECGVAGYDEGDGLVKPMAAVVLNAGFDPTPELEDDLKKFVRERLAAYKYPRRVVFVEALPRTATGKLQRFKLRQMSPA